MEINILGVRVDKTSKTEVLDKVYKFIKEKKKFYIVTPNPEIILKANSSPKLKEIINSAEISIPDGIGLKLADSSLTIIKGRELMVDLFSLAGKYRLKIYLLGGIPQVNKKAFEHVARMYPDIDIKGSPGPQLSDQIIPLTESDSLIEKEVISEINNFIPHLLFIAFGAPKQEFWTSKHYKKLNVGGVMVVGGAFDYLVSQFSTTKFMEKMGLEWLYRLIKEPKRLGRIINATIIFPITLLLNKNR